MSTSRTYSEYQRNAVLTALQNGMTKLEAAKKYHVNPASIGNWIYNKKGKRPLTSVATTSETRDSATTTPLEQKMSTDLLLIESRDENRPLRGVIARLATKLAEADML